MSSKRPIQRRFHFRINKELLPLKMFYFFFYGGIGSFIPFTTVYLKHLRLTASETGLVAGFSLFLAVLLRTAIGMLADRLNARKTALLISCLGCGVAFFSLWFVPNRNLMSETTINSSTYNFNRCQHNVSQENETLVRVCLTEDGKEICRYPATQYHISCSVVNRTLPAYEFSDLANDIFLNNQTSRADENGKIIKNKFVPNILNGNYKNTTPVYEISNRTMSCFYIDSEITNSNTTKIDYHEAGDESVKLFDNQQTSESGTPDFSRRPIEVVAVSNQRPSPTANTDAKIQCLANCKLLLVNISCVNIIVAYKNVSNTSMTTQVASETIIPDLVFLLSFLLLITGKSFYAASTSLIDAVTYTLLGPYSFKWGQQRLWGTVGTAVAVISVMIINGSMQVESFTGLFISCLGLIIIASLTGLLKLRVDRKEENKKNFFRDLQKLLTKGAVRVFLCKLLFCGILSGTSQNFIFWFLVDIGGSQTTLRVCLILYSLSSVIVLRFSPSVLQTIGQTGAMYVTLAAYTVRFLGLSFLEIAWLALPVEILHGLNYSLFWAAASSTASRVAPPGTQATSQGLAGAIYWDLGRGLGLIVSGQLFHRFGARWTFRSYGIACAGVLPVLWILDRRWPFQVAEVEQQNISIAKDDDKVGEQLLLPAIMNGHSINNNEEKMAALDIQQGQVTPNIHLYSELPVQTEGEVVGGNSFTDVSEDKDECNGLEEVIMQEFTDNGKSAEFRGHSSIQSFNIDCHESCNKV